MYSYHTYTGMPTRRYQQPVTQEILKNINNTLINTVYSIKCAFDFGLWEKWNLSMRCWRNISVTLQMVIHPNRHINHSLNISYHIHEFLSMTIKENIWYMFSSISAHESVNGWSNIILSSIYLMFEFQPWQGYLYVWYQINQFGMNFQY